MIRVGSDFSGVGAFNQALIRLGVNYDEVFACDMDKYARQTFIHNYGHPKYYPENVYDRAIPKQSLDIYMTSPPCQAFSLAGKRLGKADKRGVLFFNSHEFIQVNKPRYFIFENVKGLLSDDNGKTFNEWINYLGGKSVNGNSVLFPVDESVPYHIYWKVLNAKNYNVPQNRERVFIVGIRDDSDNIFSWPKEETLTKRLKNVLEKEVDDKYFLSEKMVSYLAVREKRYAPPNFRNIEEFASTITVGGEGKSGSDMNLIKIKSATLKGYEIATENDSINFSVPNSQTRRGRVGKEVAQTLDTACNQGVIIPLFQYGEGSRDGRMVYDKNGISPCMVTAMGSGGGITPSVIDDYKIRRLTPRECFRLMDFPDSFTWTVSDSQAYKQAGNSIVVKMLELIISRLNLHPPVQS